MKNSKKTIILGLAICLGVLCELGCGKSKASKTQNNSSVAKTEVDKIFEIAGGVDKINQEAKAIFDRFGTKEDKILLESDLKDFPAICSLYNHDIRQVHVELFGETSNFAPQISIAIVRHRSLKVIHIFPPDFDVSKATNFANVSEWLKDSTCIQVAPNILVVSLQ